ncbi:hypothetical protein A9Z07_12095 [Acinetobacter sp. YK3]|nr:hypothetical protein A9Z07_12095 [Acinetobacter sp. YK3]
MDLLKESLNEEELENVLQVLTYWRNAHILPLNHAEQLLLRYIFKIDKHAFLAKRLKRFESIRKKLRYIYKKNNNAMQLTGMQDIGGLRVVVSNYSKLKNIQKILMNEVCFYEDKKLIKFDDYINNPKDNGYRGIHLVAKFLNQYGDSRKIEIQLRTRLQHSWATSLEIIDLFTGQNLKSDDGEKGFLVFFKRVSNQFSLIERNENFSKSNMELITREYLEAVLKSEALYMECIEIKNFLEKSNQFSKSIEQNFNDYRVLLNKVEKDVVKQKNGYVLLRLNTIKGSVDTEFFRKEDYLKATKLYGEYEKLLLTNKSWVIALVSTNAFGGVKEAYPNYFADSQLFLQYLGLIKIAANLAEAKLRTLAV